MDKGSSDERLLKLIEGSAPHKQNVNVNVKKLSVDLLSDKFKSSLKIIQKFKVNLLDLNKGLIGLAGLLSLLFVLKLFSFIGSPSADTYTAANAAVSGAKMVAVGQNQSTTRKTISSQDIKRNVFLPPGVKTVAIVEDTGTYLAEEVKDLKLVGIIWSENPEVMIEIGKDSRTYSLKKGESFNNGKIKIKQITSNSATLEISSNDKTSEYVLR